MRQSHFFVLEKTLHSDNDNTPRKEPHTFPRPFNSMSTSIQSPDKYDNRQNKVLAAP